MGDLSSGLWYMVRVWKEFFYSHGCLAKISFDQSQGLKICSWQVLDSGRVHPDSKDQEGTTPLMLVNQNPSVD